VISRDVFLFSPFFFDEKLLIRKSLLEKQEGVSFDIFTEVAAKYVFKGDTTIVWVFREHVVN